MKYMRDGLEDSYGFLTLQDKILEIMDYVDKICTKYEIDYCLMGGSALGAKRHKGFIPWDDDLDIFMTPDNYEKFREVINKQTDTDFYLQEWGATNGMLTISKVRMNDTSYIESSLRNWDIHHGIYIDIFILHNCPNNRLLQLWQCFWAKYSIMKGLAIRNYDRRGGVVALVLKIMRAMPDKFMLNFALKQVYRYRNRQTDYFCNFMGKAFFKKGIYKKEWFLKTQYVDFEKIKLRVSCGLEEFLTERFGDYMKIPSADRIKWEQHAEEWDVKRGFTEILNREFNFSDEIKLI